MVKITFVDKNSRAQRVGICEDDILVSINGREINDVLDYRFHLANKTLDICVLREDVEHHFNIVKSEYDDIGLDFETPLMDKKHSCENKCIFCFIDQLPKGLRKSLYFKDDDSRLSFLHGNYITLTNLEEKDIDRIIEMHISPVNVSVHTTNPKLRVEMMKNPRAGEVLSLMEKFSSAGIHMNCQLVLCPGINDGEELTRSLNDLAALYPAVQSVAAVPVGITKYREGLYPMSPYTKEQALDVISRMEAFGDNFLEKNGTRLCYPADEFYLKAGKPLPGGEFYEEYLQIENGVGMWASFQEEFEDALSDAEFEGTRTVSMVTGMAALPLIEECARKAMEKFSGLTCHVYGIQNEFFGENITVTGLLTGNDILGQIQGKPLGDTLLLPATTLRREGDLFLDDVSLSEFEKEVSTPVVLTQGDGYSFLDALLNNI
jgi:putative radical SAM enzyme (TIGR03279 family)